jgi:hypothetical protein
MNNNNFIDIIQLIKQEMHLGKDCEVMKMNVCLIRAMQYLKE